MKNIPPIKSSHGFALIAVIFFIVIVTAAISLSNNLVTNQMRTTSAILSRTQAYFAAYSGISWLISYTMNNVGCPPKINDGTIDKFKIQLSCIAKGPYKDPDSTSYMLYAVTAKASTGVYGFPGYTQKTLSQTYISRKTS